jgi:hypothetical protein
MTSFLFSAAAMSGIALAKPEYKARISEIPDAVWGEMAGVSWKPGCPVGGRADLRLLHIDHWLPDGSTTTGELVVAATVADTIVAIFGELFTAGFPIAEMSRVDKYGGDDGASMRANNTSALNCRTVSGSTRWSQHSYGLAIDLNPLWNPWVRGTRVDPKEGAIWADRSQIKPGMTASGGPAVEAFKRHGWPWGGDWTGTKDYQHFSQNGR